jgi:CheY-like chemotaxis protein
LGHEPVRSRVRSDHFYASSETVAALHLSIVASVTSSNRKILVAAVPDLDARMVQLFSGHKLYFARTVDEGLRALERENFDLLIISVHFDDSRMFDLLRQVRGEGRNKGIPIVCVREPGLGFTAISGNTLEVTCRALDASAFLDLARMKDDEERNTALRSAVESLLSPNQ